MPFHCPVCDNTEYDEEDGLYFCTECGTQSRELILQESQNDDLTGPYGLGHEVQISKSQEVLTTAKKASLGRPWTIYEGFQYILKAQVEALVTLGADISLKNTVFTIWANYLSKLGVAFCTHEKMVPDIVTKTKFGRLRELHRGSFDSPLNHQSPLTLKRTRRELKIKQNVAEEDREDVDMVEDFEEGFIKEEEENDPSKRYKTKMFAQRAPEWMCMPKTLAICYIGLMITNPNILPCDLIRWVYSGKVPYLSATHALPDDFMFSSQDDKTFHSDIDVNHLIIEVTRLLKYFRMYDYHVNAVETLIYRFIEELFLPDELKNVCYGLVEKVGHRVLGRKGMYQRQELLAMGYIVTGLRIIFGLDGTTEKLLSQYALKVGSLIETEVNLFVWKHWVSFQKSKPYFEFCAFRENSKPIQQSNHWNHLNSLLEWHKGLNRDKRKLPYHRLMCSDHATIIRATPEFTEGLKKPLEEAEKKLKESSNSDVQENENWTRERCAERGTNLRQSTLAHYIDIPRFKESFQKLKSADDGQLAALLDQHKPKSFHLRSYEPVKSNDKVLLDQRPSSYKWLLTLCSDVISPSSGTNSFQRVLCSLDGQVCKIQELLLNQTLGEEEKSQQR